MKNKRLGKYLVSSMTLFVLVWGVFFSVPSEARSVAELFLPLHIKSTDAVGIFDIKWLKKEFVGGVNPDNPYSITVRKVVAGDLAKGEVFKIVTAVPFDNMFESTGPYMIFLQEADGKLVPVVSGVPGFLVAEKSYIDPWESNELKSNVQWEIANTLASGDEKVASEALGHSYFLSTEQVKKYVMPYVESKDADIKAKAVTCFLMHNMQRYVPEAVELLENDSVTPNTGMWLRFSLNELVLKDEYVDTVAQLLKEKKISLRQAGAYILRKSKSEKAVPYLVSATYDSDIKVRYNAIMGLAQIHSSGRELTATVPVFEQDESKYIKYWQEKYPEYK